MSDKTAPVISVILPVYNVADYIDICMESLVNQTFSDFEMLLINEFTENNTMRVSDSHTSNPVVISTNFKRNIYKGKW